MMQFSVLVGSYGSHAPPRMSAKFLWQDTAGLAAAKGGKCGWEIGIQFGLSEAFRE